MLQSAQSIASSTRYLTSSGGSSIDRSRTIRLLSAGTAASVACSDVIAASLTRAESSFPSRRIAEAVSGSSISTRTLSLWPSENPVRHLIRSPIKSCLYTCTGQTARLSGLPLWPLERLAHARGRYPSQPSHRPCHSTMTIGKKLSSAHSDDQDSIRSRASSCAKEFALSSAEEDGGRQHELGELGLDHRPASNARSSRAWCASGCGGSAYHPVT